MGYSTLLQKTPLPKVDDMNKKWFVVDAKGKVLGRLATEVAKVLRGKNSAMYTPHLDTGDFVIVINARHVVLTGAKLDDKEYRWYTGYPGAIRSRTYRRLVETHPNMVIEHAVRGMLPKNRLGRQLFRKLKVYSDGTHPHAAQKPELLDI